MLWEVIVRLNFQEGFSFLRNRNKLVFLIIQKKPIKMMKIFDQRFNQIYKIKNLDILIKKKVYVRLAFFNIILELSTM